MNAHKRALNLILVIILISNKTKSMNNKYYILRFIFNKDCFTACFIFLIKSIENLLQKLFIIFRHYFLNLILKNYVTYI